MRFDSPGGPGFLTSFSDSLQTPDPNVGTTNPDTHNWLFFACAHAIPIVDPVGIPTPKINASSYDGANALSWLAVASGAVSTWAPGVLLPIKNGLWTGVYGKSQFVQLTFLKLNGNYNTNGNIVVCLTPDNSGLVNTRFYRLGITGTGQANWNIRKTSGSDTSLLTGTDTIAAADVLRFSADLSVAGQVTLTFKQNGVVRGTYVDNTNPIITGMPAIVVVVGDTNAANVWESRTFSCGTGL